MNKERRRDLNKEIKAIVSKNTEIEQFEELLDRYFYPRINILIEKANDYIFEENYVERAWKEMVSMHYINTTYNAKQFVMRIHFFTEKGKFDNNHYLGYITVRPIPEYKAMLSYVMPNWLVFRISCNALVMSYDQEVHINCLTLQMKTFPFFAQDSLVAFCANADLMMLSMFMNKVYGYKKINLSEMQTFSHVCAFPSEGLDSSQILNLLDAHKIPARIYPLGESNDSKDLIKAYVESNLPVLVSFDGHVVTITGINYLKNNDYEFLVYDDSGFFTSSQPKVPGPFLATVSWGKFIEKMGTMAKSKVENTYSKEAICEDGFILTPIHERVYLTYASARTFVKTYFEDILDVKNKEFNRLPQKHLIVDAHTVKKMLNDNIGFLINPAMKKDIMGFIKGYNAHFTWVSIIEKDQIKIILLTDPTKNEDSPEYLPLALFFQKEANFDKLIGLIKLEMNDL